PDRSRDALRRRAEAAFQMAAVLQAKETGTDLSAAAGFFQVGARLLESTHAYERAADAYVRAGEIYFTLSQHDNARRSFRKALQFIGKRSKSEDYFLRARDLFAAAKDVNGQAQALLMLAYHALFSGGKQLEGVEAAEHALQLWSSIGNRHGIARMRSILGTFA